MELKLRPRNAVDSKWKACEGMLTHPQSATRQQEDKKTKKQKTHGFHSRKNVKPQRRRQRETIEMELFFTLRKTEG